MHQVKQPCACLCDIPFIFIFQYSSGYVCYSLPSDHISIFIHRVQKPCMICTGARNVRWNPKPAMWNDLLSFNGAASAFCNCVKGGLFVSDQLNQHITGMLHQKWGTSSALQLSVHMIWCSWPLLQWCSHGGSTWGHKLYLHNLPLLTTSTNGSQIRCMCYVFVFAGYCISPSHNLQLLTIVNQRCVRIRFHWNTV